MDDYNRGSHSVYKLTYHIKPYKYVHSIGQIISENRLSCVQGEIKVTVLMTIEHIFLYVVSAIYPLPKSSG